MDRYVVIGNPIAHSLSPAIHALFARQTREEISYEKLLVPEAEFATHARDFFASGGRGANVTLPFKGDAYRFADRRSVRADEAGAANFLAARDGRIEADNTDGAGLVADLTRNLRLDLGGRAILLLGAGGAARGVIAPLLRLAPARLILANRTFERAAHLARALQPLGPVEACALADITAGPYDLVINATSSATRGEPLALPPAALHGAGFAYDMAYGSAALPFVESARARGIHASDGIGMLVEQAAESFALWRGKHPETAPVIAELRKTAG